MLSGPLVGNLLQFLVQISGAKNCRWNLHRVCAIKMAEVLPVDGRIDTIEMNIRYQDIAQKNFLMSGYEKLSH